MDRNDNIFNNVQQQLLKVAAKSKAFLIETTGVHSFKKGHSFLPDEKNGWVLTPSEAGIRFQSGEA